MESNQKLLHMTWHARYESKEVSLRISLIYWESINCDKLDFISSFLVREVWTNEVCVCVCVFAVQLKAESQFD